MVQASPEALHARAALEASGLPIPADFTDAQLQELFMRFAGGRANLAIATPAHSLPEPAVDVRGELRRVKQQIDDVLRSISFLVLKIEGSNSLARVGVIKRSVHTMWIKSQRVRHDDMTAEQLQKKLAWLRNLETEIQGGRIPGWLS
jgi:hypothetical protein